MQMCLSAGRVITAGLRGASSRMRKHQRLPGYLYLTFQLQALFLLTRTKDFGIFPRSV